MTRITPVVGFITSSDVVILLEELCTCAHIIVFKFTFILGLPGNVQSSPCNPDGGFAQYLVGFPSLPSDSDEFLVEISVGNP